MFIALKEMRRAVGRFTLLTSAVALLVLLLLFFQAVAGTLTIGFTGGLQSSAAEVFVYDARARLNPQASVLSPTVVDAVGGVEGVAKAASIGIGSFTGASSDGDVDLTLFGGDPNGPAVPAVLSAGRSAQSDVEAVFSGSSLDATFGLGDEVRVGSTTMTVVGLADDAAFNVSPTFYVPLATYTQAVRDRAGTDLDVPVSLVGVQVADGLDPAVVAERITQTVDGVQAVDRATAVAELPGAGQISQSFSILYLLLFIVVTIVTGVFFLILTVQKADALVLLRAVGASSGDVVKPVLLQVLVVVGLGAIGGALAATGLLRLAQDTFGAQIDLGTTLRTIAIITILGLLASVGAVRRVLAIEPIQATTGGGI